MKNVFLNLLLVLTAAVIFDGCGDTVHGEEKDETLLTALKAKLESIGNKLGNLENEVDKNAGAKRSTSQVIRNSRKGGYKSLSEQRQDSSALQSGKQVAFVNQTDSGAQINYAQKIQAEGGIRLIHIPTRENDITQIYDGALENIRIIRDAEQQYFVLNGKYTHDLNKLNLAFDDVREQYSVNNTTRVYLKSGYYYVLTDKLVAVYEEGTMYHLDFYYDGKNQCVSKTRYTDIICEDLGGQNPVPNNRIHSWTVYGLPQFF